MKKLFSLALVALLTVSCGSNNDNPPVTKGLKTGDVSRILSNKVVTLTDETTVNGEAAELPACLQDDQLTLLADKTYELVVGAPCKDGEMDEAGTWSVVTSGGKVSLVLTSSEGSEKTLEVYSITLEQVVFTSTDESEDGPVETRRTAALAEAPAAAVLKARLSGKSLTIAAVEVNGVAEKIEACDQDNQLVLNADKTFVELVNTPCTQGETDGSGRWEVVAVDEALVLQLTDDESGATQELTIDEFTEGKIVGSVGDATMTLEVL